MRAVGLTLFSVGFLVGSLVTVQQVDSAGLDWQTINWGAYLVAMVVGVIGVVMIRASAAGLAQQSHKVEADIETLITSLGQVRAGLAKLSAERHDLDVYDIHGRIDDELAEPLGIFADARESVAQRYGLQRYADMMSKFALGERNINRAWSASADGYIDEVWKSLDTGSRLIDEANDLLSEYREGERAGLNPQAVRPEG